VGSRTSPGRADAIDPSVRAVGTGEGLELRPLPDGRLRTGALAPADRRGSVTGRAAARFPPT